MGAGEALRTTEDFCSHGVQKMAFGPKLSKMAFTPELPGPGGTRLEFSAALPWPGVVVFFSARVRGLRPGALPVRHSPVQRCHGSHSSARAVSLNNLAPSCDAESSLWLYSEHHWNKKAKSGQCMQGTPCPQPHGPAERCSRDHGGWKRAGCPGGVHACRHACAVVEHTQLSLR